MPQKRQAVNIHEIFNGLVPRIEVAKNAVIDIKCAKGYKTGQKDLPSRFPKFPPLFDANPKCIENEKKKQCAVHRTYSLYSCRVVKKMFHRYCYKNKYEQRNAFQKSEQP